MAEWQSHNQTGSKLALTPLIRFSLLDDASNPVDLCQQCYESAKEYASTKQYNDKNNLLLNGGTVGEGVNLTCADVKKLQSIKIHCDSGDEAGVEGDKQTVKRKQLFDDFIQRLFSEVLFTVQSSSCTGAQSVAQLARLAVEIAVEYSSGVSQSAHDRARRLGESCPALLCMFLEDLFPLLNLLTRP